MLEDIIKERKKKRENLLKEGVDPYPAKVKRTLKVSEALGEFSKLSTSRKQVFVVGRVMALRDQGNLIFADLNDESGKIQVVLKKDNLGNFKILKHNLDIGDFIEVNGTLFKTQKGEKSIEVKSARIIVKSLRAIPSDFYGLEDVEVRLRKRYLDLILNQDVKEIFIKKAVFWDAFRSVLKEEGFLEVETPVLESVPGGADAEPFMTHHNALDTDFYLRISLEIALKKLLIGGFEKVFEIGRVFRNEGIDAEHLQDYTHMEFYWAYTDYNDLMKLLETLYKKVIKATTGGLVTSWDGKKIDWGKKWPKVDYVNIFKKMNRLDPLQATQEELLKRAKSLGLKPESNLGRGRLIDLIYKKTVRPTLIQPCFLINQPAELAPLAKRLQEEPRLIARVQVVACGTELGNGFSEANDPVDERERFMEQMKLRAKGDKEAQRLDEDFLEALEYGMPPAAGFGVSERLFAVLMDKPVRETIFFPPMKRK